ncbi:hypothetical protein VTJ04DRAFT_3891 [Mycothermus thermophilus]|uniref:uncharacterized protein n=1 Tax=Humicola insolens TaxID=85995 RepID=UPI003743586F
MGNCPLATAQDFPQHSAPSLTCAVEILQLSLAVTARTRHIVVGASHNQLRGWEGQHRIAAPPILCATKPATLRNSVCHDFMMRP